MIPYGYIIVITYCPGTSSHTALCRLLMWPGLESIASDLWTRRLSLAACEAHAIALKAVPLCSFTRT